MRGMEAEGAVARGRTRPNVKEKEDGEVRGAGDKSSMDRMVK